MRLAWVTDIHLNFVKYEVRQRFYRSIEEVEPGAVLIGGDIGEADNVREYLLEMREALTAPLYFVLGNHDYYHSSIANTRRAIGAVEGPVWLTATGTRLLSETTALIGEDGWADGRLGDYGNSPIYLNDYELIDEFRGLDKNERGRLLNALGDESAFRIATKLRQACAERQRVILLTHVPPFREACWHEGRTSDDQWVPHFGCQAAGDAILAVMDQHPHCELRVLCGHTHGAGVFQPRANVVVTTGGAVYGKPALQESLNG